MTDGYDCYEHHDGGPSIVLDAPEHDDGPEGDLDLLLDALDRLGSLVRPVTADLALACVDRELDWPTGDPRPETPFWFAYDASVLDRSSPPTHRRRRADRSGHEWDVLHPGYVGSVPRPLPDLSPATVGRWIRNVQRQPSPAPASHDVRWSELRIDATYARLPAGSPLEQRRTITVQAAERPGGGVEVPVVHEHGVAWVGGRTRAMRRAMVRPALTVRAANEGGVTLQLAASWSLWTGDDSPGRADVLEAARGLIAVGWRPSHVGWAFDVLGSGT